MPDPRCPRCRTGLAPTSRNGFRFDRCDGCRGVSVNVAVLRQFVPHDRVARFWLGAEDSRKGDACPSCSNAMAVVAAEHGGHRLELDACRRCQLLWFDAGELSAFSPEREAPPRRESSQSRVDAFAGPTPGDGVLGICAGEAAGEVLCVLATLLDGV